MRGIGGALFISPHFDDVALSCGGIVALEAEHGEARIVTVFAGEPHDALSAFAAFQHRRWGVTDAVDERRREDILACSRLGAAYQWLAYLDAIYRGDQYQSDEDLFGEVKPGDATVAAAIQAELLALVAQLRPKRVYLPLGVGGHVDHRLITSVGGLIKRTGVTVRYYEDFPYAATPGAIEERQLELGLALQPEIIDVTTVIEKKLAAIAAYRSQLATIFRHYGQWDEVLRHAGRQRSASPGGYAERLWG